MEKMRVTQHSRRCKTTKHNDRNFDVSKAPHIDQSRMRYNQYFSVLEGNYTEKERHEKMTHEELERKYYQLAFSEQYNKIQERYKKQGHLERCKDFDDWRMQNNMLPEELYIQIGKMNETVDKNKFIQCYNDYLDSMTDWSEKHGNPFIIIDTAVHLDEAVPQAHIRRVWQYRDNTGTLCVGQNKALEIAGVKLPDETKARSRHNNRKQTFDKEMRELWIDVCRKNGLNIEDVPLPDGKHNRSKEQVIADKYQAMIDDTERLQQQYDRLQQSIQLAEREEQARAANRRIRENDLKAREEALEKRMKNFQLQEEKARKTLSEASESILQKELELNRREEQIAARAAKNEEYIRIGKRYANAEKADEIQQKSPKYSSNRYIPELGD